jgi:hypothetical protein
VENCSLPPAVPLFDIDESARTGTLTFHPTAPTHSFFGGNAEVLNNEGVEYCESAGGPGTAGTVYEITQCGNAQRSGSCRLRGSLFTEGKGFQASIQEYNGERLNSVERVPASDFVEPPRPCRYKDQASVWQAR